MSTLKRFMTISATTLTTGSEITPPDGKVWNVPRLYVCNVGDSENIITVKVVSGPTEVCLVKDYPLSAYDTLILENIALIPGDSIALTASATYSVHAYGAIIEEDV